MGRYLARVPLNFDAPIGKPWKGYINPHAVACPDPECQRGYTRSYMLLEHLMRLMGDAESNCQDVLVRHLKERAFGRDDRKPVAASFGDILRGLGATKEHEHAMWRLWPAIKTILEAAGLTEEWIYCTTCGGSGIDPQHKQAYDAWKRSKPPTGEGFQLWQNTSEDSPLSPVFDTLWKLADWCQDNATTFGFWRATALQWHDMLEEDNVHHQEGNVVFL